MMKANCANCGALYEFEPNPQYPRKYCDGCSAAKKAEFAATKRLGAKQTPIQPKIMQPQASKQEFHLSPEQVRSNALELAIKWFQYKPQDVGILELSRQFEQYLLNG